jgi:plasmid stabilization system protein ParE
MTTAGELSRAVRAWLDGLDGGQLDRATFPFETPERFAWAYTPDPPREGLPLGALRPEQRVAADAILAAATSARTAGEVAAIVALERILGEMERATGRVGPRRDPDRYWLAVFGEPGRAAPWSWRIGGHHVTVHLTVADDEVIGATPSFLGANPAVVPSGSLAGRRTLPGEEDLARAALAALTPAERRLTIVDPVAPSDILSGTGRHADVGSVPIGIRHADLGPLARAALERLVRHYLDRARPDVADAAWDRIVAAGIGDVTFAWSGSDVPGRGHYYAVRGPSFVIEYDNTQNEANHVHAVWRELGNDWGEDLLAEHLGVTHRPAP